MNLKIAAAVTVALGASASAFASDLTTSINVQNGTTAGVVLNVAGSSAARDGFEFFMANNNCQAGTFDEYAASPTAGQDFRAYTCRIVNDPNYGGAANQLAVVYYRAEGGSAWGIVPMSQRTAGNYTAANDIKVMRLNLDNTCTVTTTKSAGTATFTVHGCPLPASDYLIGSDTSNSGDANLVLASVDLGTADEEPKMFSGVNYPTISSRLTVIPAAQRDPNMVALGNTSQVGFGQTFGVILNTSTGSPFNVAAGSPKLVFGKSTITNIFNGKFKNWNQIVGGDGNLVSTSSLPITVCRREAGSGTQVAAHQYFLGVPGCNPQFPNGNFVTAPGTGGQVVIESTTTGDLTTCVQNHVGAIGIAVGNAAPSGTQFAALNGSVPTRNAAAVGAYDEWFELTLTVNPRLAAGNVQDLANGLILQSQLADSAPNAASVISLPNDNNDPLSQPAFNTGTPPISFGSRGGNSCSPIIPVLP